MGRQMLQCRFFPRYLLLYCLNQHLRLDIGNEDDYIIISVVRSRSIGFLKNLRRTNVMLTRCKRGMFIVSSQQFLNGPGAGTLVGSLLVKMSKMGEVWVDEGDIEKEEFDI